MDVVLRSQADLATYASQVHHSLRLAFDQQMSWPAGVWVHVPSTAAGNAPGWRWVWEMRPRGYRWEGA